MGPAPSSVKATVVIPSFSLLKQLGKQSPCSSGFAGKEKPAAELPACKYKHARYADLHMSQSFSREPAETTTEALHSARGTPGFQDPESSGADR